MIVTIVLDRPGSFLNGHTGPVSLLSLPLGPGTVLQHVAELASQVGSEQLYAVRHAGAGVDSLAAVFGLADIDAKAVGPGELPAVLRGLEPSDRLLIVDPRFWPTGGHDFPALLSGGGFPGAIHVVGLGSESGGTVERLRHDEQGRVQCIRRLYNRVTQVEAQPGVVPYSAVPASAVQGLRITGLGELRLSMAARGVLSRDLPITADLIDLTSEPGLLAANEHLLTRIVDGELWPDYSRLSPGVLLGRGALVAESAEIVPPVIIQQRARVEPGVKLIGPSLIAAESTVGRGAVIAQALVLQGSSVPAGSTVLHRVASASDLTHRLHGPSSSGPLAEPHKRMRTGSRPLVATAPRIGDTGRSHVMFRSLKRSLDFLAALLALLLLFPLFVVVAVLIRLESRGSVLFSHQREGEGGRPFRCLKFRTMCRDAHQQQRKLYERNELDGPQFKLKDDPRVTRVGRLLRRTNVDELPQLINVLLGHMSLIGPRPSPFRENQICVPWRRARLSVRPGITGLWQICRSERASGDFQQWIFYDTLYVRRMSLWLDLKILLATALTLGGRCEVPLSYILPEDDPYAESADIAALAAAAAS